MCKGDPPIVKYMMIDEREGKGSKKFDEEQKTKTKKLLAIINRASNCNY
jgi:hypothetical protein